MTLTRRIHQTPRDYLVAEAPDEPVLFVSPETLHETARAFVEGFPGLVTYAVKANPAEAVVGNLLSAGIDSFDVASLAEIALVRSLAPKAALHYNNPVRSRDEIAMAVTHGVASYSVDDRGELLKLAGAVPRGREIAVRFKLPVAGAAYDFGEKFGASPGEAADLLAEVVRLGYRPALTFHPGTQCTDPDAWGAYIRRARDIASAAGVTLDRLNVGGGFPARRMQGEAPPLARIFDTIAQATRATFGAHPPDLVCEPGRAMVAEAVSLALRVKAMKGTAQVYLNDGLYGALAEQPIMGMTDRLRVLAPDGTPRRGTPVPRLVWGPTCDSLDRLPGEVPLPVDMAEGDYIVIDGMGAYSTATVTRFNGYGGLRLATVRDLGDR
jgi:ornithine decarboxylase